MKHLTDDHTKSQTFDYEGADLKQVATAVIDYLRGEAEDWWSRR